MEFLIDDISLKFNEQINIEDIDKLLLKIYDDMFVEGFSYEIEISTFDNRGKKLIETIDLFDQPIKIGNIINDKQDICFC